MILGQALVVRGIPTSGEQKLEFDGRVMADCLHENFLSARVQEGGPHPQGLHPRTNGHVPDLTPASTRKPWRSRSSLPICNGLERPE